MGDGKKKDKMAKSKDEVNSRAIVKYSAPAAALPATYFTLKCNTNLNLPPSNWTSHQSYGMQEMPLGFSSFRMSHMFPDCIGEVDVVSSAENIKRLLKMPYAFQTPISLMVHRVGNTILIDDFDIHKYLRQQSESDWKWLKSFIKETILNSLSENDRQLLMQAHNQKALRDGSLTQKFFGHSVSQDDSKPSKDSSSLRPKGDYPTAAGEEDDTQVVIEPEARPPVAPPSMLLQSPVLPEPKLEEKICDPDSSHSFNRNVLWTFEDIRMLIGTDMPIFGGVHRPCISLRLRDTKEPINVLTGIDYWLDNLMSNVPEVVMCYHLDGIVQKYELVKTEDLPYLEDSKFSPKVVRNVAQNILAFLKQNATKAGHTYWLFKGPKDDVVKLYDLTTLCSMKDNREMQSPAASSSAATGPEKETKNGKPKANGPDQNPFTTPVGMLLYTVARNMKMSRDRLSPKQAGTVKALLENCIKLLPVESYPQIVTSSHYMLSDLYVPTGIDPSAPNFPTSDDDVESLYDEFEDDQEDVLDDDDDEEEEEVTFFDSEEMNKNNVAIQNIQATATDQATTKNWKHNARPPSLLGSLEKRCQESLEELAIGLKGLKFFKTRTEEETEKEKKDQIIKEEQNLNMARSNKPIPLPYEKLQEAEEEEKTKELLKMVNFVAARGGGGGKNAKRGKKPNLDIEASTNLFLKETSTVVKSWDVHLKLLLLEKACLTYSVLAESCYRSDKFGVSLRYINLALNCQKAVVNHLSSLRFQTCCLLGRAGDCYFQIIKSFNEIERIKKEFSNISDTDKEILKEIQDEIQCESEEISEPSDNIEGLLLASMKCYELAIDLSKDKTMVELLGRLGNVQNELGVKYMYHAQAGFQELVVNGKLPKEFRLSIDKSMEILQKGIATFEKLNDVTNLSLVCSNMGRLYRLQAHIALKELEDFLKLPVCAEFYSLATTNYQKALSLLESKKRNPTLWDVITWELSTASYTIAKLYFEAKSEEKETREKTIAYLQTALKNCDLDLHGARYEEFYQRTGDVHFMLGFSHEALLSMPVENEKKKKSLVYLTFFHYDKSLFVYETSSRFYEFTNVAIFEMDFLQTMVNEAGTVNLKLKYLGNVKELIEQFVKVLENLEKTAVEEGKEVIDEDERLSPVLLKLEEKMKNYFMTMIKCLNSSTIKSKEAKLSPLKLMFSHLLRNANTPLTVQQLVSILLVNFKKIRQDLINSDLLN